MSVSVWVCVKKCLEKQIAHVIKVFEHIDTGYRAQWNVWNRNWSEREIFSFFHFEFSLLIAHCSLLIYFILLFSYSFSFWFSSSSSFQSYSWVFFSSCFLAFFYPILSAGCGSAFIQHICSIVCIVWFGFVMSFWIHQTPTDNLNSQYRIENPVQKSSIKMKRQTNVWLWMHQPLPTPSIFFRLIFSWIPISGIFFPFSFHPIVHCINWHFDNQFSFCSVLFCFLGFISRI